MKEELFGLKDKLEGDLFIDESWLLMYSTDASMYREKPLAVSRPKNVEDIKKLALFAKEHKTSLIPRTAGTSLAGQVVGSGIVVDVSKYMNSILELNVEEHWVKVQPGVVLDELNNFLKPHGLFFGPETSSSNRCMIGGMVGNNSCGSHSLVYGSVRDHLLSVKAVLSDSTVIEFNELPNDEFSVKTEQDDLEGEIYKSISNILSDKKNREQIQNEFPDKNLRRRNTGYAIDLLLNSKPLNENGEPFNFCKLIAGSEGTLVFMTELKLNLVPLPPTETAVVCVHITNVNEATRANLIALKFKPVAVELLDKIILDCTKENIGQRKNRFFIRDDPGAILIVEFAEHDKNEIDKKANAMIAEMKANSYGFHYPVLYGNDINKVWSLRKAGLGLLSNVPGE
jgi:FAD/FMN-containing dehydrogenase